MLRTSETSSRIVRFTLYWAYRGSTIKPSSDTRRGKWVGKVKSCGLGLGNEDWDHRCDQHRVKRESLGTRRYQPMQEILSKVHHLLTHNVLSKIWAFLVVSRVEFMVMGIPVIAISALLAASRPTDLMGDGAVRLGLLAALWYLAYWICSQVNCIADYELDKTYKSRLPRSIDILKGPRTVWAMIVVEVVIASAIVVYLAISESRVGLVVLWVVGLLLIAAYSLEPLRFKRRGFLNLVTLSLILYFLPALYIYYAMAPQMKILPLLALLAFSTQMIGLLLVNQIEDYHEDKQMNVLTSSVRWGLKKAALVALLFTAVMSVVLLIVFSMLAKTQYAFMGVAIMLVAYAATLRYHFKLFRAATSWEATHAQAAAQRVRQLASQVPLWFFVSGMPLVLVAGINLI
jgi:4-hydroxybenzoate polyprenyltransferase